MKALKWNYKTHKYEDYKLPEGCILITDLEKVVSCAECGTKHEYGTMYTSRKIHNCMGFGFPVCQKCYKKELSEVQNLKEKGMFDLFEEILGIFCLIFLIIIFLAGLRFLGYATINGTLYLLDKSECVATVAGNVVYDGRCHFISVQSIGNSKDLTIYNDIFGFKPKARYINQDIEVTND